MPNLENLRKQAKQILKWHRNQVTTVAPILRAYKPEFESLDDRQILATEFRLAEAQEVVARREGFETWAALVRGCQTMNPSTNTLSTSTLTSAEPQLFTLDMQRSLDFYQSILGFSVRFSYGDPPFYAQVFRDSAKLNLRLVHEPVVPPEVLIEHELLSASITVENIKELFLEFKVKSAEFFKPLSTEPWGARTMVVKDPDGNLILFAG